MSRLSSFSETFDTEIKGWLNPQDPTEAAKIARACIALRNNNGGQLIFGFDDKTFQKSTLSLPLNVRQTYHPDVIQNIVSKFALPKFDVEVLFEEKDGQEHAIILVKGGIEFPVMTKSSHEKELRQNTVYVRTLSNNTVSSSEPKTPDDWDRLIRTCFDNREADIGRFFRRHLSAITTEVKQTSASSAAEEFLKEGKAQFDERMKELAAGGKISLPPLHGAREVSFIVQGEFEKPSVKQLLDTVFVRQPHYTGWPPWVDSRSFGDAALQPYVKRGGWEALIVDALGYWEKGQIDFWRIEPSGRFYCLRTLEDDTSTALLSRGVQPGQFFDFVLLISRTAEILGTGKAFAEALGANHKGTQLDFVFRLTGLKGRNLYPWSEPGRRLLPSIKAEDSEVTCRCSISLEIPQSALWQSVKVAVQPVFDAFGSGVGDSVIEEITNQALSRSF